MNPIPSATTKHPQVRTHLLVRIALVTAITCILAPLSIPLPFSPVPLSLTNLVLYISIFILGWKAATVSYLAYLLLGAIGLPVFSGFAGGLGKLAGPTGGYLVGMIFLTILSGWIAERFLKKSCSHLDRNAARLRSKLSVWNCLALCTTPPILCRRSDNRSSSLSLFLILQKVLIALFGGLTIQKRLKALLL